MNINLSPLKKTAIPVNTPVNFSGNPPLASKPVLPRLMNYDGLDVLIDNRLLSLYEKAETQWHEIMNDITPDDIEPLINRVNEIEGILLVFDKEAQRYNTLTYRGLTTSDGVNVQIKINPTMSKEETFLTIGHELIHALHFLEPEILKFHITDSENKFDLYQEYFHLLPYSIPTPSKIKAFFTHKKTPIHTFDNLKHGYLTEAIAHELEDDLIEKHQLNITLRERQTTLFARAVTALNKLIHPTQAVAKP